MKNQSFYSLHVANVGFDDLRGNLPAGGKNQMTNYH